MTERILVGAAALLLAALLAAVSAYFRAGRTPRARWWFTSARSFSPEWGVLVFTPAAALSLVFLALLLWFGRSELTMIVFGTGILASWAIPLVGSLLCGDVPAFLLPRWARERLRKR